jgi:hypothetical protein
VTPRRPRRRRRNKATQPRSGNEPAGPCSARCRQPTGNHRERRWPDSKQAWARVTDSVSTVMCWHAVHCGNPDPPACVLGRFARSVAEGRPGANQIAPSLTLVLLTPGACPASHLSEESSS